MHAAMKDTTQRALRDYSPADRWNWIMRWPGQVEAWPARVPDLYHGQPLSLAVNFGPVPPSGELVVSGLVDGQPWQRRLQIGYNRAATLIERMEEQGVISAANHAGKRDRLRGPGHRSNNHQ